MLGDAVTNKGVKAPIRAILLMTTRAKKSGSAPIQDANANPQAGVEIPEVNNPLNSEDAIDDGFSWDGLMEDAGSAKTREDILRECLADAKHFRRMNNLHIKNVKAFAYLAKRSGRVNTRITFVIKERIPGMVVDETVLDAFGQPTKKLGTSTNVFSSAFAVSGAMKESAKGAIFADAVANMTAILAGKESVEIVGTANIANTLYAGGVADVLCQFVPANTPYRNPFSTADEDEEADTFDEDRIFHHVVRLQFGEVGEDAYRARLTV